ncbi:MAG: ABC transporter permease [bacterium]|nr:ABC transporter permease [bacterium]
MSSYIRDIRHGWRKLYSSPGFSVVVVLTLALGIGVNSAIFSLVNALLLRPLPYVDPDRLVTVNHRYTSVDLTSSVSVRGFREYRDTIASLEQMTATTGWVTNLTGVGNPERLIGGRVSHDYFETFGVAPLMGRSFLPNEDVYGSHLVVILSHGFWISHLGADSQIVGKSLQLNGETHTVVGVMPADYRDFFGRTRQLWRPLALTPEQLANQSVIWEWLRVVARVTDGMTVAAANEELAAKIVAFKEEFPDLIRDDFQIVATTLDERAKSVYKSSLVLLSAAVGMVLLLTCANVAGLLLARSVRRRREISIRGALGARRGDLVRMLLAESLVLAGLGGAAGLALAFSVVKLMLRFGPEELALSGAGINGPVLVFTAVLSLFTGVLFGLVPAIQVSNMDLQGTMRAALHGSLNASRIRMALVAAEFAFALILLTGAGLLIRSLVELQQVNPGFRPDNVLSASISIPQERYSDDAAEAGFYGELRTRLNALPGVDVAGTVSAVPFSGNWGTSIFNVEGYVPDDDHPRPWGDIRGASSGYDRAIGLPVLRGRFFDDTDTLESLQVAVVDRVMAEQFWPDQDPIGKRITFFELDDPEVVWMTVVGVVDHAMQQTLDEDIRIQVYYCEAQNTLRNTNLVIRTQVDPLSLVSAIRETVLSIDSAQPIADIAVVEDLIVASVGDRRAIMVLLTIFAGLAVLLASLGIYGVMSHLVEQRTREIGIRMTCGATAQLVISMFLKHGMALAAVGSVAGFVGLLIVGRWIRSQLYEVSPFDPLTLVSVVLVILGVAAISTFVPALRASRSDPVICMRSE